LVPEGIAMTKAAEFAVILKMNPDFAAEHEPAGGGGKE
jgi:hypothetical protein